MKSNGIANQLKKRLQTLIGRFFSETRFLHQKVSARRVESVIQTKLATEYFPHQTESDALRMKAIVLLHNQSLKQFLPQLLNAPIEIKVMDESEKTVEVRLTQQIELQGKKLCLEGRFIRYNSTKHLSLPIPNSFKIKLD